MACVLVALLMGGCSSPDPDAIDWYVATDNFGAKVLAESCSSAPVRIHQLPRSADRAHASLIRRLAADRGSVDLLTVAGSAVPELADAGYLQKQPESVGVGVLPAAAEQVTRDGDLYAVPWLFDPQLLWFRSLTAERAGIDTSKPVGWDDVIAGANRLGLTVQIADDRNTGLADWVTALGSDATAAGILELYRDQSAGPGPSRTAVADFAGSRGGFLIAPASAWSDTALAPLGTEIGVAPYPVVEGASGGPGEGIVLAVPQGASEAVGDLVDCLTSDATLTTLVGATGYAPARATLLDKVKTLPTATVLKSVLPTATTGPVSPHWNSIRRAIDRTWQLSDVSIDTTPAKSKSAIDAAIDGRLP